MSEQQFGWNYFENEVVIGDKQDKKRMIVIVLSNFMDIPYNRKSFDEIVDWLNELSEENEQLKEELQRFKKYVFSQDNILCYKCEHCIKKDIYVVDCELKGKVDVHGLCSLFRRLKV